MPDRTIPPVNADKFAPAALEFIKLCRDTRDKLKNNKYKIGGILPRSRYVRHSVPKRKHSRRLLSIPNPLHQGILCCEVAENWAALSKRCNESKISVSIPRISSMRAVEPLYTRGKESIERAKRSVARRYVLKTDLARFYPFIYTHSIGWATDGQDAARADKSYALYGNRLDFWIRETQDKQTGGIPIGPDTSFVIAELIASRLDKKLQEEFPQMTGTRYIDDFSLYFVTQGDAERALSTLHSVAREFELEINDLKTEIGELPEALEPRWKTQLRSIDVQAGDSAISLQAIFDRASELAQEFPSDSVFTYLVKKLSDEKMDAAHWDLFEALLLRCALAEPNTLPTILRIYQENDKKGSAALRDVLDAVCQHYSSLQQGNEVAWALWIARSLQVNLSQSTAKAVAKVDDDIVALVALDLENLGLLPKMAPDLWSSRMNEASLYSEHWLLAYEACEQGWLGKGYRTI